MKILITGATGCLGRNLVLRLLQDRTNVVLATGRNQKIGNGLIEKGALFKRACLGDKNKIMELCKGQNIVFHCGALSSNWGKYEDFYMANVIGTKNIIEGCKKYEICRLIYVSTPSIYFDFLDRFNIKETDLLSKKYINHYVATKLLAEKLIDQAAKDGLDIITIRPKAIFGPYDQAIIPRILHIAQKGYFPLVNKGKTMVDVTYVENVVDALLLCSKASKKFSGRKYNITNNSPIFLKTLLLKLFEKLEMNVSFHNISYFPAYLLATLMEVKSKLFLKYKEPKLTRYSLGVLSKSQTLDITAAKKDLGYDPKITIEKGLDYFVKWWKETYET